MRSWEKATNVYLESVLNIKEY